MPIIDEVVEQPREQGLQAEDLMAEYKKTFGNKKDSKQEAPLFELPDFGQILNECSAKIQGIMQMPAADLKANHVLTDYAEALTAEIGRDNSTGRQHRGEKAYDLATEFLVACVSNLRAPHKRNSRREANQKAEIAAAFDTIIARLQDSITTQQDSSLNIERPADWNKAPDPHGTRDYRAKALDGLSTTTKRFLGRYIAETKQIIDLLQQVRPTVEACADSVTVLQKEEETQPGREKVTPKVEVIHPRKNKKTNPLTALVRWAVRWAVEGDAQAKKKKELAPESAR